MNAVASNHSGGVTVRASEHGIPVSVFIARQELRREAAELAADVLRACRRAAASARAERRRMLAAAGVPADVVDRLHPLGGAEPEEAGAPKSWLRPL